MLNLKGKGNMGNEHGGKEGKNTLFPWGTVRRYNSYADYFRREFGERVQKVSVNAGFTCPNRDGTKGSGGCTYCSNPAFSPSYLFECLPVREQIEKGMEFHRRRYRRADKYLAYFQSYTNTYSAMTDLRKVYEEALSVEGVMGLVIGTRPDCVRDELLDYLQQLSEEYYLIVEYGIESCYNRTLQIINRGHDFETSVDAVERTAARGIRTGAHMIFGLPGETEKEMLRTADILSQLPLNNVKFRQLQIVKGTQMAGEYSEDPSRFRLFGLDEYLGFMVGYLERLNPLFVVERFAGEVPPECLAGGERWGIRYERFVSLLEEKLEEAGTWQGRRFKKLIQNS